jgi:hypothetical protein
MHQIFQQRSAVQTLLDSVPDSVRQQVTQPTDATYPPTVAAEPQTSTNAKACQTTRCHCTDT